MSNAERSLKTLPTERLCLNIASQGLHHVDAYLLPFERNPAGSFFIDPIDRCRSIDVLRWNKLGYLRSPRWFSLGLDQRRRAGGVHQRRNPTSLRAAEIPKPLVWRGLERCRATGLHRLDAVPVRWRTALVCVFGCCKRSVLRSSGHQALRCRTTVRAPSLLPACLRKPTGIGTSARARKIAKDQNATGRQPEHA